MVARLQVILAQSSELEKSMEKPLLKISISMNGHGYLCAMPRLDVDVMVARDALKRPAISFKNPAKVFARKGLHSSIS
jgi:hypothetical protein